MFSLPQKTPCLNCVFPSWGTKNKPIGVLGATAGVIGTLEANMALLWLLDHHNPIENKLLLYDGFRMSIDLINIKRDKNCSVCGGGVI
jgi:adenylyltransferase/sulfurtransferase